MDILDIDKLKIVPSNLSYLKSKVDKLDIEELETTPVKKTDYDKNNENEKKLLIMVMINILLLKNLIS